MAEQEIKPAIPEPDISPVNEPHWTALKDGVLKIQKCRDCGHHWLPAREDCPNCLSPDNDWVEASGKGKLISWVVYHVAFNKAFADKLPYNVAVVELEEGARAITNIVNPEAGMAADKSVEAVIEEEDGVPLARFRVI